MTSSMLIQKIRARHDLLQALADLCDFDLSCPVHDYIYFRLDSGRAFTPIAGEGAGGVFCLLDAPDPHESGAFFVSSEGQGGFIAKGITETLSLLVTLPYWFDCLKFSRSGQLAEMDRAVPLLEAELHNSHPHANAQRKFLCQELGIQLLPAPLVPMHQAVCSGEAIVNLDDGWRLESLFNSFSVDDNPLWADLGG